LDFALDEEAVFGQVADQGMGLGEGQMGLHSPARRSVRLAHKSICLSVQLSVNGKQFCGQSLLGKRSRQRKALLNAKPILP
jgi:hypothetical protein